MLNYQYNDQETQIGEQKMLELENYCITEIENLQELMTIIFVIVDDLYEKVTPTSVKMRKNKKNAKMSDSEIMTIAITGETIGIDSETSWYNFVRKNYRALFPEMCDRTRYNRTHRDLAGVTEMLRQQLNGVMEAYFNSDRLVDSFPLAVCEFGRAHFCRSFKSEEADYGHCASKKETYFGYKVHNIATTEGYITDFCITPASTDDRDALLDLAWGKEHHYFLIGDKGYIKKELADFLYEHRNISLIAIQRKNAKDKYPPMVGRIIVKMRRRVETTFSQLSGQFNAERVLAKIFHGLLTRLITKFFAFNLMFFINFALGNFSHPARVKSIIF
jgi:IS5 family transposase